MQTSGSKSQVFNEKYISGLLAPQAIFGGVVIAVWISTLLNFLGLGWSFTTLKTNTSTLTTIGSGSILWLILSSILAMFGGGWVSGWLSPGSSQKAGAVRGVIICAVSMLATMWLATTAVGLTMSNMIPFMGQGLSAVGGTLKTSGKTLASLTPSITQSIQEAPEWVSGIGKRKLRQSAERSANQAIRKVSNGKVHSPEAVKAKLREAQARFFETIGKPGYPHDTARRKLIAFLKDHTDMNAAEAEQSVTDWQREAERLQGQLQKQANKGKQAATQAVLTRASSVVGKTSLLSFLILSLATAAGAIGGALGSCACCERTR